MALARWTRDERADISRQHALPTWFGFLQEKAAAGSAEALALLRDREQRREQALDAFWAAADAAKTRDVVFSALRPKARKDGAVCLTL